MIRSALWLLLCMAWAGMAATPPHIVFMLVDDLGFAGVGFNSPTGEPHTPTIDALAAEGAVLSRHYTYQFCSPSRSSFLSGRLPIHVNERNRDACEVGGGVPKEMTTVAAMLRSAGYSTHHAGKWHAGMSSKDQLPINRGFDSSLAMLSGGADHFTNEEQCGGSRYVDLWKNDAPAHGINGTYSDYIYVAHIVDAIQSHDASKPFFAYMAFQNVHSPTQAPERFFDFYNDSIYKARLNGLAQISAVDEGIDNITVALKSKGMWSNTLLVFSSDNGGPDDHENNFPLRGSKGSCFEGGIRVVAFVSGGWLPDKMRGTSIGGLTHIADWYSTFAALADVSPDDDTAAQAGLPAIDSLDMSRMITGHNLTSLRTELAISFEYYLKAYINGKYKLLLDTKERNGYFPGPTTPNGTDWSTSTNCSVGCLFDVVADPSEHHDLSSEIPDLVASLTERLLEIGKTTYHSPGERIPAKEAATMAEKYGGFWGPWESTLPTTMSVFL